MKRSLKCHIILQRFDLLIFLLETWCDIVLESCANIMLTLNAIVCRAWLRIFTRNCGVCYRSFDYYTTRGKWRIRLPTSWIKITIYSTGTWNPYVIHGVRLILQILCFSQSRLVPFRFKTCPSPLPNFSSPLCLQVMSKAKNSIISACFTDSDLSSKKMPETVSPFIA